MSDSDDQNKCQQMVFVKETTEKNTPLTKIGNSVNIVYECPFNNFTYIVDDVAALSNSGGGSIWIGIKAGRCIGCSVASRKVWLDIMSKLRNIIYGTIVNEENRQLKFDLTNYVITSPSAETYMASITVKNSTVRQFVCTFGMVKLFGREQNKTVELVPTEREILSLRDILDKFKAHNDSEIKQGDVFAGEESEVMEFKLSFSFLKEIGKYFSSFGNSHGGQIIVGVTDKGIVKGVKIPTQKDWDEIKLSILKQQYMINNVQFLSQVKIEKIPIRKKYWYLVKIIIPKSEETILVRDKGGVWNKWVRVLSSSVKDDRTIMFTQKEYQEMEARFTLAEAQRKQSEQTNKRLLKTQNDIVLEVEEEREKVKYISQYAKDAIAKYENLRKRSIYAMDNFLMAMPLCLLTFLAGVLFV